MTGWRESEKAEVGHEKIHDPDINTMKDKPEGFVQLAYGLQALQESHCQVADLLRQFTGHDLPAEDPESDRRSDQRQAEYQDQDPQSAAFRRQLGVLIKKSPDAVKLQQKSQGSNEQDTDHIEYPVGYHRTHDLFQGGSFVAGQQAGADDLTHPGQAEISEVADHYCEKGIDQANVMAEGPNEHLPAFGPADIADGKGQQHEKDPEIIDPPEILQYLIDQAAFFRRDAFQQAVFLIGRTLILVDQIEDDQTDAQKEQKLENIDQCCFQLCRYGNDVKCKLRISPTARIGGKVRKTQK